MATLTPKQRMKLKALAHSLKPILYVGKEGVTEATVRAVEEAFNTRELLKVKVQEAAPETARETAAALTGRASGVHLVHVIGKTVILYRRHPERPLIELPQKATTDK